MIVEEARSKGDIVVEIIGDFVSLLGVVGTLIVTAYGVKIQVFGF